MLDTKYMSTAPLFKELISSNVLGHMKDTLSEAPFEMPIVGKNLTPDFFLKFQIQFIFAQLCYRW